MQKAEWDSYKLLCEDRLSYEKIGKSTNSIEGFSSTLLGVANETIPETSKQAHKRSAPWFNDSCKMVVAERKKSLHAFINNPTNLNQTNLRIFRAKARRTIKQTICSKTCQKLLWIHYYVYSIICGLQVISHHPGQKPPSSQSLNQGKIWPTLGTTGPLLWLAVFVKHSNDLWIVNLCGF